MLKKNSIALLVLFNNFASAQHVDYEFDNLWNIGFDIGAYWIEGDYQPTFGLGASLTLGRAIFERPARPISYELRMRLLGATAYGNSNGNRDYGISSNPAWNGIYDSAANYSSVGYVYHNYRTSVNEYSLEAVAYFHALLERTGILLHIFGGIGFTQFQAKSNLLDSDGTIYNFGSIDTNQSDDQIADAVREMLHGDYESFANQNNNEQSIFTPSVGIGLGYQISPRFSMGIEHKIGFTFYDYFDGGAGSKTPHFLGGNNDINHYSCLYFRWNLFKYRPYQPISNSETTTNQGESSGSLPSPRIDITKPISCPAKVSQEGVTVKSTIHNISRRRQLRVTVDGQWYPIYSYSKRSRTLRIPLTLRPGMNEVSIRASNQSGETTKTCQIEYTPVIQPPTVNFTTPYNNTTVTAPTVRILANTSNISNKGQITLRVNGNSQIPFTFNNNGVIEASVQLRQGSNSIEATVQNQAGEHTDQLTINYVPQPKVPPTISFVRPQNNNTTVQSDRYRFEARVTNIKRKDQLKIQLNGTSRNDFQFNANSGRIDLTTNLVEGNNVITISAFNEAGNNIGSRSITYRKTVSTGPKPTIVVVNPNPFTTEQNKMQVVAKVQHISNRSQLKVKYNGKAVSDFLFDPALKQINYSANNLILGANNIDFVATNDYGTATKKATIIRKNVEKPCNKPIIKLSIPKSTTVETTNSKGAILAAISNATNVRFVANSKETNSFNYNPNTGKFEFFITKLPIGESFYKIIAENICPNNQTEITRQKVKFTYRQPCIPPTLKRVNPRNQNTVTFKPDLQFETTTTNILNKQQVKVIHNGALSRFDWNPNGKVLARLKLKSGENNVIARAQNECGNADLKSFIKYTPIPAPFIRYASAGEPNLTSSDNTFAVLAYVHNVDNKNQIKFTHNGQTNTNFTYDKNQKLFRALLTLAEGQNKFVIIASNDGGSAKSEALLNFKTDRSSPAIIRIRPEKQNSETTKTKQSIELNVKHVSEMDFVEMIVNDKQHTSFDKVKMHGELKLSAEIPLKSGSNNITIVVRNKHGKTSQNITITRKTSGRLNSIDGTIKNINDQRIENPKLGTEPKIKESGSKIESQKKEDKPD